MPGKGAVGMAWSCSQRRGAADLASVLRRNEAGFRDSRTGLGLGGPLGRWNPDSAVKSCYQEGHVS